MEEILLLNKFFFPIVDTCLSCAGVPRWQFFGEFLGPAFPVSCADLHFKFALGPQYVSKYGRHLGEEKKIDGKKERKKKETTEQKYNGLPYYIGRP